MLHNWNPCDFLLPLLDWVVNRLDCACGGLGGRAADFTGDSAGNGAKEQCAEDNRDKRDSGDGLGHIPGFLLDRLILYNYIKMLRYTTRFLYSNLKSFSSLESLNAYLNK